MSSLVYIMAWHRSAPNHYQYRYLMANSWVFINKTTHSAILCDAGYTNPSFAQDKISLEHCCISVMMSSNGNIFPVTGPMWGDSTGGFPHKDQWLGDLMFYLVCAWKKLLKKQSRRGWFETPSRSIWRHRNALRSVEPTVHWAAIWDAFVFSIHETTTA